MDDDLLPIINAFIFSNATASPPAVDGQKFKFRDPIGQLFVFDDSALQRLSTADACLNDDCLNGCAALLLNIFPHSSCAIFSTLLVKNIQDSRAPEGAIWRLSRQTQYWSKKMWILPIHRPNTQHWVVCSINPELGSIHLFDSFGEKKPWQFDFLVGGVPLSFSLTHNSRMFSNLSRYSCVMQVITDMNYHLDTKPWNVGRHCH